MQKIGDNITVEKVKQLIHDGEVKYNLIDPIYKDTWTVPRGGFTIVRCFLNNPGKYQVIISISMIISQSIDLKNQL